MLGKIDTPSLNKLKEKFIKGGGSFKNIKIGKLFDIHPTKSYGINNDKLFKNSGKNPVIVNSSSNNGVGGYANLEPTETGNKITFSDTTTYDAIFYQPNDFIGYSHVQGLYPYNPENWNSKTYLYFLALFKKSAYGRFDYANKFNRNVAKKMDVLLPINQKGEIDFCYMEDYIAEIKDEYIKRIDKYIEVSELKNCILTNDEKAALDSFLKQKIVYKEYRIEDLFTNQNGDTDIQQKDINNKGVYVVSSGENNYGIIGKSDINAKIIRSKTITMDMFGSAHYRDYCYKMVTHARVFSMTYQNKELTKEEGLFFESIFFYFKEMFSYNNMASWEKIKNIEILLPIDKFQNIDYSFMNNFIKAQEKLVIKKVIEWNNNQKNFKRDNE